MKPPRSLRTIHNGSHDVAKALVSVPAGATLTVSSEVADQLQRDPAFKDGEAPEALLAALYPEEPAEPQPPAKAPAKPKAKVAKAVAEPAGEVEG